MTLSEVGSVRFRSLKPALVKDNCKYLCHGTCHGEREYAIFKKQNVHWIPWSAIARGPIYLLTYLLTMHVICGAITVNCPPLLQTYLVFIILLTRILCLDRHCKLASSGSIYSEYHVN